MVKLFFFSNAYLKIKCEGIILDKSREYVLTNEFIGKKYNRQDNKILLESPKNFGYMPNYLGKLYFDEKANYWVLKLSDSIQNKNHINKVLPFVRKSEKNGDDYEYFSPSQKINFQDLENGIVINRFGGTTQDRIELKIFKEADLFVLKFDTEAINREYKLKKYKQEVSILFNSKTRLSDYNFYFEKTSKLQQEHQLKITTEAFGYRCFDENENEIKEDKFAIGNALFSIKPIISFWEQIIFIFLLFQAIWFSIFLISKLYQKENPIKKSLLLVRLLMNQLVIIGLPLFMITFDYHENWRKFLLIILFIIFNVWSNDFLKRFLKNPLIETTYLKFNKFILNNSFYIFLNQLFKNQIVAIQNVKWNEKWNFFLGIVFFLSAFIVFAFCNRNERIFGAPALHFQKLIIIIAYVIFSSKSWEVARNYINSKFQSYTFHKLYNYIPLQLEAKNVLILLLSAILSIASKDFGALLYVFFAIIIIEFLNNKIALKSIFTLAIIVFAIASILSLFNLEFSKLFRIIYWVGSPDNKLFHNFNEADRETISYLYHGLKNTFFTIPFGLQQDLIIPTVCKSVSFSDYAFFWSFMLNGFCFLAIFITISFFLAFHFIFLLYFCINKIQINKNTSIAVCSNKYGSAYAFWFAITFVSFIYPIITNLALPFAMLTGQSLPFISVGIWDMIIIIGLIKVLERNFKSVKHSTNNTSGSISSKPLFNKIAKLTISFFLFILMLIFIKGIQVYFQKDEVEITKKTENESFNFDLKNKNQIDTLINSDSLTDNNRKKIAALQYAFYKNQVEPKQYHPPFKMSRFQLMNKVSLDSFFKFNKMKISGIRAPFGNVYSKKYFINGKAKYLVSNPYYTNCLIYDSLNNDLNAEITKKLEKHIKSMNRKIEGTVIIRDNQTGKNIVVATYPIINNKDNRELAIEHTAYFVGSVKKPILLIAALSIDEDYKNFIVKDSTMTQWIAHSSNNFTQTLLADILKNHPNEFDNVLSNKFGLPFFSMSVSSYCDYTNDKLFDSLGNPKLKDIRSIGIGGNVKYSPMQVVRWYQNISNLTFDKNDTYLKNILNAPLQIGTAKKVAKTLKENGIDPANFIAKTGTFQKKKNEKINLSSTFVIANKDFTILVTLNGEQQANNEHKSAKYFFNKIIPLLLGYDVLHKS